MPPEPNSAPAGRREPERAPTAFEDGAPQAWWLRALELAELARRREPSLTWRGSYHLGDAILEIDVDDVAAAESIRDLFGECALADARDAEAPSRVRFRLRSLRAAGLVCLDLETTAPLDGVEIVCGLLEPRPGARCSVRSSPLEGWRLVARHDASEPVAAISERRVLVRARDLPSHFLRDFAAAAALRIQSGVLFLHGASACIGGAGVLLAGRAGAGKTTLALTLASRGHGLLGDDLAALRIAGLELLPLRRTLHIRRGPRAALVEKALRDRRVEMESQPDSTPRAVVEARRLFPDDPIAPSTLRAAFFLRGFRKAPARERFVPSLSEMETLRHLPVRLQWGITPARRMLRFAQTVRCLSRVPCYFLDVGLPEQTADLIEETMEDR